MFSIDFGQVYLTISCGKGDLVLDFVGVGHILGTLYIPYHTYLQLMYLLMSLHGQAFNLKQAFMPQ